MKAEAEASNLPPVYRGPWASASPERVQAELDAGTPHCYRFRVPPDQEVVVHDLIRGDVVFNTASLGDFVVMRSNGLPVYNFCVAVDDALMGVTHVLRAEEHLPNTLRQLLVYDALGLQPPAFGHMSLILAPDKSKLSKRHGATSVGEFREQARTGHPNLLLPEPDSTLMPQPYAQRLVVFRAPAVVRLKLPSFR